MNKETTKVEATEPSEGLRAKVEITREKAREILRAKMISNRIQKIFGYNADLKQYNTNLVQANKAIARVKYRVTKLDKENPDYEDLLKNETTYLETATTEFNEYVSRAKKNIEGTNKAIDTANAEISDIEAGKMKVNIDEVKSISDNIIAKGL